MDVLRQAAQVGVGVAASQALRAGREQAYRPSLIGVYCGRDRRAYEALMMSKAPECYQRGAKFPAPIVTVLPLESRKASVLVGSILALERMKSVS